MAEAGAQAELPAAPTTWCVAVEPAPLEYNLRETMLEPLTNITSDAGCPLFFDRLAALDPPILTVDSLRNRIVAGAIKSLAQGVICKATLKTLARLIDPAGFWWAASEPAVLGGKRRVGGNGNNKPTLELADQLEAEGVAMLDLAAFSWGAEVFQGVPKKGQAASLGPYVHLLFDNMWQAQNKVRAATLPSL
jgi:hypothetical protein